MDGVSRQSWRRARGGGRIARRRYPRVGRCRAGRRVRRSSGIRDRTTQDFVRPTSTVRHRRRGTQGHSPPARNHDLSEKNDLRSILGGVSYILGISASVTTSPPSGRTARKPWIARRRQSAKVGVGRTRPRGSDIIRKIDPGFASRRLPVRDRPGDLERPGGAGGGSASAWRC